MSDCSKCSSHDKTHENGSQIAPVESGQGRTLDEERLPARYAKSGLETPKPCIHSLTEQSEYLRSKLLEVDAALERFKRPAAGKSANAKANTSRDGLRTVNPERQTDDQKQTVASLQEECRQLWEKVTHLSSQNRLEDKDCRLSDANDTSSSMSPREELPPTLTPSEPKPESLNLADRKWCLELLKMATSLLEPDATLDWTAPASPSDGKKKKKKGESKFEAPSELPYQADQDQFGMPLVEQPPEPCPMPPVEPPPEPYMNPFEMFLQTQPPKKWTDITRVDVRWWIRTALYVCQILRVIGVIILVFKAPGMLRELLDFMHPSDRCIGIRIPR